MTLLA